MTDRTGVQALSLTAAALSQDKELSFADEGSESGARCYDQRVPESNQSTTDTSFQARKEDTTWCN